MPTMNTQNLTNLKPVISKNIIARPRFDAKLNIDTLVYWISAPAGFGKTISTLRWLQANDKTHLWLSCAKLSVSEIIENLSPELDKLNQNKEFYCVLDNVENLAEQELMAQLPAWIIEHNYHLRIIIISRKPFDFLNDSAVLNANLQVISATDLVFNSRDIEKINRQYPEQHTQAHDHNVTLSQGWPIFVRYLERTPDLDDSFLENYIKREVWPYLPLIYQRALRLIAALNGFSKALINANLTEITSIKLHDLKLAGLILNADEHTWYEIHPILKHYLQTSQQIDITNNQLTSCARWLQRNEKLEKSIYLLNEYKLHAEIADILKQEALLLRQRGQAKQLHSFLGLLPWKSVYADPRLLISYMWSMPDNLRLIDNNKLEDRARTLIESKSNVPKDEYAYLMCELNNVCGYNRGISGVIDNMEQATKFSLKALEYDKNSHTSLRSRSYLTIGLGHYLRGDTESSITTFHLANKYAKYENDIYAVTTTTAYLSEIYRLSGNAESALRMVNNSATWCHAQGFSKEKTALWFNLAAGATLWGQGKYVESGILFETLEPHREGMDFLQQLIYLRFEIDLYISQHKFKQALESLKSFDFLTQESTVSWSFGRADVDALRAKLNLYQNNMEACKLWTDSNSASLLPIDFQNEDRNIIFIRCCAHLPKAKKLFSILKKISQLAKVNGRERNVVRCLIIEGLIYHHSDDKNKAQQAFNLAFSIAEARTIKQPFLDEAPLIETYIDNAIVDHHAPIFCTQLKSRINKKWSDKKTNANQTSFLSKREIEVLGLLAEGFTKNNISQELDLSPGTIKVHTKNIYTKLGVNNKTQAINQAKQLGWLV